MSQTLVRVVSALFIENRKVLFVRSKGNDLFYCPGGKIEQNETIEEALRRELKEEISIRNVMLMVHKIFVGPAPNCANTRIEMITHLGWTLDQYDIDSEIEELKWFSAFDGHLTTKIGQDILANLQMTNLID